MTCTEDHSRHPADATGHCPACKANLGLLPIFDASTTKDTSYLLVTCQLCHSWLLAGPILEWYPQLRLRVATYILSPDIGETYSQFYAYGDPISRHDFRNILIREQARHVK
jgi:hypothetical protein